MPVHMVRYCHKDKRAAVMQPFCYMQPYLETTRETEQGAKPLPSENSLALAMLP